MKKSWLRHATVLAILIGFGGPAVARDGNLLVLDVVGIGATFDKIVTTDDQGPFYIAGDIFDPETGVLIGAFHCWGWFIEDGDVTIVNQEYDLFDRGKIQVQGVEDGSPRAVTGGTGEFINVRGQMTEPTDEDGVIFRPAFTVTFELIGAGAKRGGH